MQVRNIPKSERPRERFLREGVSNLSNQELLAIIIKTGTKNLSSMDLAFLLLNEIDDIHYLKDVNVSRLIKIKGIGLVKAIEIASAIELGKRIYFNSPKHREKLINAKEIYESSKYLFVGKMQEEFYCLYFNFSVLTRKIKYIII